MKASLKILFIVLFVVIYGSSYCQDWKAFCITDSHNQNQSNTWIDFMKEFELQEVPPQVMAKIACDSKYWMWINGELAVFEGQLKRGPNPHDTYYDQVDITSFLREGNNKIAILTWYFGKDGFSHKSSGQAGLVFECNSINIKTDETWLSRIDPAYENTCAPFPNFRLSESNVRYNAQNGDGEWFQPNGKNNGFQAAKLIGPAESTAWNKLVKRPIPMFKDYGLKGYENIPAMPFLSKGDTIVCELPYNAQITPCLKIESEAGNIIDFRTDHYFGGGTSNVRAEYVTKDGIQEYESLGWMNGHKVCYYIPEGIKVLDLQYRETGFNTDFTGSFDCNDSFFNSLWKKSTRTLYVTMRDTYMDCPDRERAQWWGDVVIESGETFYSLDTESHSLIRKGILELIEWQRDDSTLFAPIPAGNWDKELPGQMLASIGFYGIWNYYMNTGDQKLIEEVYDGVKRYLNLWKLDENGVLKKREGGWYWGDWGTNVDKDLLVNEWYYLALDGFKRMSELLEKKDEVTKTTKRMQDFRKAFNQTFWRDGEYRSYHYTEDTDDRGQALAVVAGLANDDKFAAIFQILEKQRYASPYMEKYVTEALFQMGKVEFGLKRLKERFGPMVNDKNSTTLYEGWGIGKDGFGGGSSNHAWSGGGLTILSQYVCGLYPLTAGWKTIQIKPQLGNLEYASTGNQTVAGWVDAKVSKENNVYIIDTSIPEGSEGIVCIPEKYKKITLNSSIIWNKRANENSNARFLKSEKGYLYFAVKGGKWHFEAN